MAYSKKVNDHFNNPRNIGSFDENDKNVGHAIVGAPECGDVLQLSLKIENEKIADAKFLAYGCGSAIASSSYAIEELKGKTLTEAQSLTNDHIAKELSLPPVKRHCSILVEQGLIKALKNYNEKNSK